MVTLQEYLDKKYPTKEEREKARMILVSNIRDELKKQNIKLEPVKEIGLSDYVGLTALDLYDNQLTSIDLSKNTALTILNFSESQLTNVDFLNSLPNPEKLRELTLFNNNIQPTDIAFFSRFKNIETLKIGTISKDKHNQFYGSFESLKDLDKLRHVYIESTDIDRGLEYLPLSLAKATGRGEEYGVIECSPYKTDVKCQAIQSELLPFNYDLEAWQLAHPEKMLISRPELFTNPDSREQWIKALENKIIQSQQELQETKTNLPEKLKRIERLESKINHLQIIKNLLEELAIERDHSQDINNWYQRQLGGENAKRRNDLWNLILELKWNSKQQEQEIKELEENIEISNKIAEQETPKKETEEQGTQTELTGQDYEKQQKENQELREKLNKLTIEKK